jgi:high mobility group protein B2
MPLNHEFNTVHLHHKKIMTLHYLFSHITPLPNHLSNTTYNSARILSAQYKALTDNQMKKWTKKAELDKLRYQEEMKHYVPMEDPTAGAGGKRKKAKKDPNAPKRNMSAYFLFSVHIRPTVKEENPEATFGDIARIISAKYKALDVDTDKKDWEAKAAVDKIRYQTQMEAYRAGL